MGQVYRASSGCYRTSSYRRGHLPSRTLPSRTVTPEESDEYSYLGDLPGFEQVIHPLFTRYSPVFTLFGINTPVLHLLAERLDILGVLSLFSPFLLVPELILPVSERKRGKKLPYKPLGKRDKPQKPPKSGYFRLFQVIPGYSGKRRNPL